MSYKDLHAEPFDESTIFKLELFEDYTQAWLPTFIMQSKPIICIFDFFAGTGYDKNGVSGSPIRILDKINEQIGLLFQKNVRVHLYLNEYENEKFRSLVKACDSYLESNPSLKRRVDLKYFNEDFEVLFPKLVPKIDLYPSLVFLDQNGIKYISEKYFLELEKLRTTDFLYFISSSHFWRFGEQDAFKVHLEIDMKAAKKQGYKMIHQTITQQVRSKLPPDSKLVLYPFSIKKKANIHGIIFGATHPRAVDKFLDIGWKRNGINGNANFDINDDLDKGQIDLFAGKSLTKKEAFKNLVTKKILSGEISDNSSLLGFTYSQGHIPQHAADCLRELKLNKKVHYDSRSPLVNYDNVHKKENIILYYLK